MKDDITKFMQAHDIDLIFISGTRASNAVIRYLVPNIHMFHTFLVLRKQDRPVLLYNDMERDEAAKTGFELLNYNELHKYGYDQQSTGIDQRVNFLESLFRALQVQGRVMFHIIDNVSIYYEVLQRLQAECPKISILLKNVGLVFGDARQTKDEQEIAAIRAAGQKTCQIFEYMEKVFASFLDRNGTVVDQSGEPVTIGQIKQRIDIEAARRGLIVDMDTIFTQGRDAGIPHSIGEPDQILQTGKSIVFDFFPSDRSSGYSFDMTRSYCFGDAPEHLQKSYQAIAQAIAMVQKQLKVGLPISTFHNNVCDHFEQMGYPTVKSERWTQKGYTHSLGHGIGVEIHENPSLSSGNSDPLQPGMVFTVEPGLYFPDDEWGLRLEDIFVVNHDETVENLTTHPKNFVIPLAQFS